MNRKCKLMDEEASAATRAEERLRYQEKKLLTDPQEAVQRRTRKAEAQRARYHRWKQLCSQESEEAKARRAKRATEEKARYHRKKLERPPPVCVLATAGPSSAVSVVSDEGKSDVCQGSWSTCDSGNLAAPAKTLRSTAVGFCGPRFASDVVLYPLPSQRPQRFAWVNFVRCCPGGSRSDWSPVVGGPRSYLCSRHFAPDCFMTDQADRGPRVMDQLKPGAKPTLYYPVPEEENVGAENEAAVGTEHPKPQACSDLGNGADLNCGLSTNMHSETVPSPGGPCASRTMPDCVPAKLDAATQYSVAVATKSTTCFILRKECKSTQCFAAKVSTNTQATDLTRFQVAILKARKPVRKKGSSGVQSFLHHQDAVHQNMCDRNPEIYGKRGSKEDAAKGAIESPMTATVEDAKEAVSIASETMSGSQECSSSHLVCTYELSAQSIQTQTGVPNTSHQCSLCSSAFVDDSALQAHMTSHVGEKPLKCSVCGRAFGFQTSLKYHMCIDASSQQFKCETCLRTFPTFKLLRRHKLHTHKKPFKCPVCSHAFSARKILFAHMRRHAGQKPYACNLCPEAFSVRTQLLLHVRHHEGERLFKCETCSCSFLSNRARALHMRAHDKKFQCTLCPEEFSRKELLSSHMRNHTGERQFECEDCSWSFTTRAGLREHRRVHNKPFKCTFCPRTFSRKTLMLVHLSRHTGDELFKCRVCSEAFAFKLQLLNHMSQHEGITVNKCTVCSRVARSKSDLVLHMRQHTGERPFRCETCAHTFATRDYLVQHMSTHEKSFRCSVCSHAFSKSSRLKVHMRQHTGERPFKCDVCSRQFPAKSELSRHVRQHTLGTPFKCEVCARAFGTPADLKRHARVHINPLKCNVCALPFASRGELTQHLYVHERPFKCYVCLQGFSRKSNMLDHLRRSSGDRPFKCTCCSHTFSNQKNLTQHMRHHEQLKLTGLGKQEEMSVPSTVADVCSTSSQSQYAWAITSTVSSQSQYAWTGQYTWTINENVLN